MSVECVIFGILQVLRNNTTKENGVHLVVDGIRFVPCDIGDRSQIVLCLPDSTHSSKVNKINVLSVLKLGS